VSDISERLRAAVADRAEFRCEYCLIHEDDTGFPLQVDHIVSRKHGGRSSFDNLAYACILCNRHKGSDIASIEPETGNALLLFDPRRNRWSDHFRVEGAVIIPVSKTGEVTIRLLRLNASERVAERQALGSRTGLGG
jgi:HNH endonuclease